MLRRVSSPSVNTDPSPSVTPPPSPSASNVPSSSRSPDSRFDALTRQRPASSADAGASTSRVRQATLPRAGSGPSNAVSSDRPEGGTPANEPYENPFVQQRPWLRQAIAEMSAEGAETRRWRPFKKSASKQYLYAKSLTRPQRDELAQALEHEFRHAPRQDTRLSALGMWLSVQQARLRTHDPAHRQDHDGRQGHDIAESIPFVVTIPIAMATTRDRRRRYYNTPLRPEYRTAFDSFMSVIGDQSLDEDIRHTAAARLEYHWRSEGTIAPLQQYELEQRGVNALAASGYRASTDPAQVTLTAGERAFVLRMGREATTPDIWAGALRSELEHVRRSVAYIPDRRRLPAVEAQIRGLERDLDVAERAAAQAREEAGMPMPAANIGRGVHIEPTPSVIAAAGRRLSSLSGLTASNPMAMAQALEAELSDLAEQERPEHLRLSDQDYRVLVETAMAEVTGTAPAERTHSAMAVREALDRWQQIQQAERESHSVPAEGETS